MFQGLRAVSVRSPGEDLSTGYERPASRVKKKMKLLPEHCKGARGMLSMTQAQLAREAGVSAATLSYFEDGERTPSEDTLLRIQSALEKHNIEFLNSGNPGVRIRRTKEP